MMSVGQIEYSDLVLASVLTLAIMVSIACFYVMPVSVF